MNIRHVVELVFVLVHTSKASVCVSTYIRPKCTHLRHLFVSVSVPISDLYTYHEAYEACI